MVFNFLLPHLLKEEGGGGGTTYKYLGFYTTIEPTFFPTIMELIINYTGGSISNGSTDNIATTQTGINDAFHYAIGIQPDNTTFGTGELSKMFDKITDQYANGARFTFTRGAGANRFYFWIELETPIPDVTGFTYWSGGAGGELDKYAFMNLHIYGTNTNPLTMGTNGDDMNNLSNWTELFNQGIKKPFASSYP